VLCVPGALVAAAPGGWVTYDAGYEAVSVQLPPGWQSVAPASGTVLYAHSTTAVAAVKVVARHTNQKAFFTKVAAENDAYSRQHPTHPLRHTMVALRAGTAVETTGLANGTGSSPKPVWVQAYALYHAGVGYAFSYETFASEKAVAAPLFEQSAQTILFTSQRTGTSTSLSSPLSLAGVEAAFSAHDLRTQAFTAASCKKALTPPVQALPPVELAFCPELTSLLVKDSKLVKGGIAFGNAAGASLVLTTWQEAGSFVGELPTLLGTMRAQLAALDGVVIYQNRNVVTLLAKGVATGRVKAALATLGSTVGPVTVDMGTGARHP